MKFQKESQKQQKKPRLQHLEFEKVQAASSHNTLTFHIPYFEERWREEGEGEGEIRRKLQERRIDFAEKKEKKEKEKGKGKKGQKSKPSLIAHEEKRHQKPSSMTKENTTTK